MLRIAYFILCAFFVVSPLFPFEISGRFFEMEAEDVVFDSQTNDIQAKGNVEIVIEDYIVRANEFYYNDQTKDLIFKGYITITKNGVTVVADVFKYNTESGFGGGEGIRTFLDGVYVSSERLKLSPDKAELFDLIYSTCDRKEGRHYELRARRLEIFRKESTLVSHSNDIYFYNRKLLTYRTLNYDSRKGGTQSVSSVIPDIGRNRVDGDYIRAYRPYYLNKGSNGHLALGVTQKRGSFLGVKHSYNIDSSDFITLKGDYYVNGSNLDGGVIYERSFFSLDSSSATTVLESVFFNKRRQYDYMDSRKGLFSLHYLNNEIENSTLVNYYPMLMFDYWDYSSKFNTFFRSKVSTGYFEDERTKAHRHHMEVGINKILKESPRYILSSEIQGKGSLYKGESSWGRSFGIARISFSRTLFKPVLSYTKRLLFKGESPFLFDSYNTVSDDELGASLEGAFSRLRWNINSHYVIKEKSFRSAVFELGLISHCWGIYVSTDVILSTVSLGLSINKL